MRVDPQSCLNLIKIISQKNFPGDQNTFLNSTLNLQFLKILNHLLYIPMTITTRVLDRILLGRKGERKGIFNILFIKQHPNLQVLVWIFIFFGCQSQRLHNREKVEMLSRIVVNTYKFGLV